jgi:hypothetical protein
MAEKISHDEVSARGGRCRSDRKLAAVKLNLQKAQAALLAKRAARADGKPASE